MNETEKFLKGLEDDGKASILEQPLVPEKDEESGEKQPDGEKPEEAEGEKGESLQPRNRRERRLAAKLQAERESSMFMAGRLEAITEAKRSVEEGGGAAYLKSIERIYGTDSPEALAATELLKESFKSVKEEAKQEALEAFREEQRKAAEAVKKEEGQLDTMLEELEDEYDVDLTSKSSETVRKGFFKLLEKMSPKDREGNIIAYADHRAVWDEFQSRIKKPDSRAKDLSTRSMVQSGSSGDSTIADDAATRYLKENGII